MKLKPYPALFAILALILSSLACQTLTNAQPTESNNAPTPQQDIVQPQPTDIPTQASIQPATVPSKGAGILCAGSSTGLSCLDENGWQVYTDENSELPNNYLYAGAVCPDGKIAIAHISGVTLFDGKTWTELPETDSLSSPEGIACEANDGIWVAHFQGVSHFANGDMDGLRFRKFGERRIRQ